MISNLKRLITLKLLLIILSILLFRLLDRVGISQFRDCLSFIGQKELYYDRNELKRRFIYATTRSCTFMIIIVAWLADSWIGKYNLLLTACIIAILGNVFSLTVLLPLGKFKLFFYYLSWICYALFEPITSVTLPAFLLDQFQLPRYRSQFRSTIYLFVIMDTIAVLVRVRISKQILTIFAVFIVLFINIIIYLSACIFLWTMKKHFRIKYYFRVIEKIIASSYSGFLKKRVDLDSDAFDLKMKSLNWLEKTKHSQDIKLAGDQLFVLIKTLTISIIQYVTLHVMIIQIALYQMAWMANDNNWFINISILHYLLPLQILSYVVIDFCIIPVLKKCFQLYKSDLGQISLSMIFLAAGLVVMIFFQSKIESTTKLLPNTGYAQIRIYNGLRTAVFLNSSWARSRIEPSKVLEMLYIVGRSKLETEVNITADNIKFRNTINAAEGKSTSYIICHHNIHRLNGYDKILASVKIKTAHLTLISCRKNDTYASLKITDSKKVLIYKKVPYLGERKEFKLKPNKITAMLNVNNTIISKSLEMKVEAGGVYVIMIPTILKNQVSVPVLHTIAERSSIAVEYLFIPLILMAMFITSYEAGIYRFVGTETPEIVRTSSFAIAILYQKIATVILETMLFDWFQWTISQFSLISLFTFVLTNFLLFVYFYMQYKPYQWPE